MTSTSCNQVAREVLEQCLAGSPPERLPAALLDEACAPALFGTLVEGLADRFEPALCDAYAHLFAQAVAHAMGGDAAALEARYRRVRRPRPVTGEPRRVFVLSRVTLGADVAVTSVLLAAARQRFPQAEVIFVGPRKNCELFTAGAGVDGVPLEYCRGGLAERLSAAVELTRLLAAPDSLVIDPDSRLTQLGLLPVCEEARYHLFESRSFGGSSAASLPELTADWAAGTLGVAGARPYVAVPPAPRPDPYIAVSLGVGENLAKRIPDPFEENLLRMLAARGLPLYVDRGAGGKEAERVVRAVERSGAPAIWWEGSFAGFAAIIAQSRLYVGYDSAGQHVAAALGVPLVSIFAGFPAPRMFHRWRPIGAHVTVIRVDRPDPAETLARVAGALASTGV